jgi:hypothetical protein
VRIDAAIATATTTAAQIIQHRRAIYNILVLIMTCTTTTPFPLSIILFFLLIYTAHLPFLNLLEKDLI